MPPAQTDAEPTSLTDEWPIEEFHAFLASSQEKITAASFAKLEAEDAKKLIEAIPAGVRKQFKLPTTLAEYKVLSKNAANMVAGLEAMVTGVIDAWVSHDAGLGRRPAAKWGINGALEDVGLLKLLAEDPDVGGAGRGGAIHERDVQWDDEHTQVWLAKQDFLRDLSTLSVFDAPDVQALVDRYDVSCESDIDSLWASLSGFATERISREPGLADALAGDITTGLRSLYSFKKAHLGWPGTHTHTHTQTLTPINKGRPT